jgi:Zn-finger nucleic acid-binding protein
MICPSCSNPMIVLELEEVETDYCISCKGIWLDSGELESLLEDSAEKEALLNSIKPEDNSKEKILRCPICSSKMKKVNVGIDDTILLDECKHKHGFWFDGGEIFEVIKFGSVNKNNSVIKLLSEMYENEIKLTNKEEQ